MELGVLGLDGFQCSENASTRSVGIKQEGSGFCAGDWRFSKVAKTDGDYSPSSASTALFLQNNRIPPFKSLSSDANMLSFSSCSKSDTSTFPYFQQMAGVLPKHTGYYSGALNTSAGMFVLNGVRGPFTQSQWYELEQQALIYKYLTANEPIPAYLLIPIKKALESAGLFGLNGGTLRPPPWGWSPFFGYSNSTDPEPGRCRRTDGKKWRCSKDAMPDQKYCERHMNRGRHRSRKLVEGQGNAATKSTATKLTPPPPLVTPRGGLADNLTQHYHQSNSLQHSTSNPAVNSLLNRMVVNQENSGQGMQDTSQLSFLSLSGSNINSRDFTFPIPKHENSNKESTPARSTYEVPSDGSSSILWPGLETTELSMSTNDKAAFLPLRVSQQLEMGLSVGAESHNSMNFSWKPSSWEPSMGGPLGEALQSSSSNNIHEDSKNTSALNLLPMGWDKMGSYQLSSSSPTGVLQRSSLVSLSNSSAGSSPRAETSKTIESVGSFCNDQLGSTTLAHSTSMPASD